jgi:predicted GNAT family N-acyltransferase
MDELIILTAQWAEDSVGLSQLRNRVFVDEQKVPLSLEIDGLDAECQHVKALIDDVIIGTGRLLPNGSIGRMCVLGEYRNRGIGTMMLKNLVQQAVDSGYQKLSLNSQSDAIPFYQKFGFIIDSEEFIEAGIPHRRMILNLNSEI